MKIPAIICHKENEADIKELPDNIKAKINFYPVETFNEVACLLLQDVAATLGKVSASATAKKPVFGTTEAKTPDRGFHPTGSREETIRRQKSSGHQTDSPQFCP